MTVDPTLPNDAVARAVDGLLSAVGVVGQPLWLAVALALVAMVAWTVGREQRHGESPPTGRYLALTLLFVAWARWPALALSGQANTDENVWIAAAALLRAEPVPWVAVDTFTGGALIPIPLVVGSLFVGDAAWGMSRGVAILLWVLTLALLYVALRVRFGGGVARLAMLPAVASVAVFRDEFDFLSYNSEHVGNLILAGGLALDALMVRAGSDREADPRNGLRAFALGAVLGLAPWAKLQVAPIAFALGVWRLGALGRRRRYRLGGVLVAGALAPTGLFLLYLGAAGALHDFWLSYVQQNLHYAGAGLEGMFGGEVVPFHEVLLVYPIHLLLRPALLPVVLAAVTLGAYVAWLRVREREAPTPPMLLGGVLVTVAAWVTMQTREVYGHYLLLLIPPLVFLIGALLEGVAGVDRAAAPGRADRDVPPEPAPGTAGSRMGLEFLAAFFVLPSVVLLALPNPAFDPEARALGPVVPVPEAVAEIARWTEPGDRVAIWGWATPLLIETGTLAGTRDVHTERQLLAGPYQAYFAERYVSDLAKYRPVLFVDALSPSVDPALMPFRQVDAVRRAIDADYEPLGAFDGIRIYRRIAPPTSATEGGGGA